MAAVVSSPKIVVPAALTGTGRFETASLYVGDLERNVNEGQLYDLFSQIAPVLSARVCRDQMTQSSLGYGYVNYSNARDAADAMENLNYYTLNGKPIRIMFSHRDPLIRKTGFANLFIKNLETSIDNKALHETFSVFGNVLSCKVAMDSNGHSKGHGFVQFDNDQSAKNAIEKLDGMLMNDKKVYVGYFVRRQERSSPKFTNVYVKNLSESYTDEDLKQLFNPFGVITSAVIMKHENGNSKCFGFVNFQSSDSAATAVEKLNGSTTNDGKVLFVGRAQKKSEREAELKAFFEQEKLKRYEKFQGANLYLKNIDKSLNEEKLKEQFSEFGTITSCKVMSDARGRSKGVGFVAFTTPEEASKAINEMNGKMIGQKPLYVSVAQRKEDRKAQLQAYFSAIQVSGGNAGYHSSVQRLAPQQIYYEQGTFGLMAPQPNGYGFQPQFMSGVGTGFVTPNYLLPYHLQRQGHPGNRMGGRAAGNFQQVRQKKNQMRPHNPNQGLQNGVGMSVDPGNQMMDPSGSAATSTGNHHHGPLSNNSLASALASASQENQHRMLEEHLHPLVGRLAPTNQTAKVTRMLLEMDQSEVIHLIESPEELKMKVAEAMRFLREASQGPAVGDKIDS
ncbi:putative polyadenylate binding protein [Medicago truncatula]|uniref:Polyadenylate-binding protein n=4 Tax=Medicago truncatula TaxID=3880 RepID=A0A396HFD6_MEDTR|nr:polyadenylate-binding protein 3-like [Medicago truncatula]XP_039691042.1 polyadenylate-binding protein 3-like [Medicago truncatula]RHN51251.1 putative polyadenylate binding protein [Medicago truncatula]